MRLRFPYVDRLTLLILSELRLLKLMRGESYRHTAPERCKLGGTHAHSHGNVHALIRLRSHQSLSRLLLLL